MALVKDIKAGDKVGHFGSFFLVKSISNEGNSYTLTIQENGRTVERTEDAKTNMALENE